MPKNTYPNLGIGVGLRIPHYPEIFDQWPEVDFFEIISENFMINDGPPIDNLKRILSRYKVVQHGVSMSLASADELDFDYLAKLKKLCDLTQTPWLSDHLCWTRAHTHQYHDLLPVPYTKEYAHFIAEKARIAQDYLERPLAIENLSSYVSFSNSEMTEWEFYTEVVEKAGAYMMLDINNVFVSSVNHGFDPFDYLAYLPYNKVLQVHVAGHTELDNGTLLDTHNNRVRQEVWQMYEYVHQQTGGVSTILEWDADFVSFEDTLAEAMIAKQYQSELNEKITCNS